MNNEIHQDNESLHRMQEKAVKMTDYLLGDLEKGTVGKLDILNAGTSDGILPVLLKKRSDKLLIPYSTVTAVEANPGLAFATRDNLRYANRGDVRVLFGDATDPNTYMDPNTLKVVENNPRKFNRILVDATVPPFHKDELPFLDMLQRGGVLVCPIGGFEGEKERGALFRFTKDENGRVSWKMLDECVSTELGGSYGWIHFDDKAKAMFRGLIAGLEIRKQDSRNRGNLLTESDPSNENDPTIDDGRTTESKSRESQSRLTQSEIAHARDDAFRYYKICSGKTPDERRQISYGFMNGW